MEAFIIEIADLVAKVQPLFVSTRDYCRFYLSAKDPELYVNVSERDLIQEQLLLEEEAREDGLKIRKFTGPFLERAVIQRRIAEALIHRNTLLLHGSTVAVDGYAYLFSASCGTGKSTHTKLWRELFGSRAIMVNDDKTFLSIHGSNVIAYGSPWSGKHGLDTNVSVPLKGICRLRRGSENRIRRIEGDFCRDFLCSQIFFPEDPCDRKAVFPLIDQLCGAVPLWEMECTKAPEAAIISHQAMSCSD